MHSLQPTALAARNYWDAGLSATAAVVEVHRQVGATEMPSAATDRLAVMSTGRTQRADLQGYALFATMPPVE